MDRQGISSPVFNNNDGANNYITKALIFDLQRQMQGAQSRLRERIENLSIDIRHSEARQRDYIDNKLSAQKEEQDARMEEIRTLLINRSSPSSSSRRRRSSHKSSERKNDASASRPRPHLHGDHHHVCDPPRHEGLVTSKQHVHDNDERHLHRAQARQRQYHHEDARDAPTYKSQQALLHAKSKPHDHKRRPRDKHHQDGATATPTTLASSPSDFKASSPLDIWHLRQQAPQDYAQEKLPKLKSATSTSYYDLDTDNEIPFYGTQEPEEYLEWERLMDNYLKLHQVPPKIK